MEAISTHTPLAGRDVEILDKIPIFVAFLLTRPSRDVTASCSPTLDFSSYFYSHAPRGT